MTREELLAALTHPMGGQQLRHAVLDDYDNLHGGEPVSDLAAANVFTSEMTDGSGMHKLVLDIDFPVKVIPSSTEGHFHLVIDKPVTKEGLFRILWALADEGIVEEGYASSSEARGYTALRVPWVRKGAPCCEPTVVDPDTRVVGPGRES